jgi:predicted DNA-binding transcriptional regulator YafY
MKRDLFRRYAWLVDTIRHAKKIPFEGITEQWLHSPLNDDHSELALRTFHNHRLAIENLFGIRITCDRSDRNQYYIADYPDNNAVRLKIWMLHQLSFPSPDDNPRAVARRILLDRHPENTHGLMELIDAMEARRTVAITYSIPTDSKSTLNVEPYCLRFCHGSWYLLGKDTDTGVLHPFWLDRVLYVRRTDRAFTYPADFRPKEFLQKYFAMDITEKSEPVTIGVKIGGRTRDKVRTLPMHETQKEVMVHDGFSLFEFNLIPGEEFKAAILSQATDSEVVYPAWLRDEITSQVSRMAEKYAGNP